MLVRPWQGVLAREVPGGPRWRDRPRSIVTAGAQLEVEAVIRAGGCCSMKTHSLQSPGEGPGRLGRGSGFWAGKRGGGLAGCYWDLSVQKLSGHHMGQYWPH